MKTLEQFQSELPIKGEWVTPSSANIGPLDNRKEILILENTIGDPQYLVNNRLPGFSSEQHEIINTPKKDNLVKHINSLKIDIGNKCCLQTLDKVNTVNSLNELKREMYTNDRLESILSRYTDQRRGDFIQSGLLVTYDSSISTSVTYPASYYSYVNKLVQRQIKTCSKSIFGVCVSSKWVTINEIVKSYEKITPDPIINTTTNLVFKVSPGICYIDGHKISFKETTAITIPYINDEVNEDKVDSIYIKYKTLEELINKAEFKFGILYQKGNTVVFNNKMYIARNNILISTLSPDVDFTNWLYTEEINTDLSIKVPYLSYEYGVTTTTDTGEKIYNLVVPEDSMLLARIIRSNGNKPKVIMNENASVYTMNKIKTLYENASILYNNTARLQAKTKLIYSGYVDRTRNVFSDSFTSNEMRDPNIESMFGSSANIIDMVLSPSIKWTTKLIPLSGIVEQLPKKSEIVGISQLNYTSSDLINEYAVDTASTLIFNLPEYEFLSNSVEIIKNDLGTEDLGKAYVIGSNWHWWSWGTVPNVNNGPTQDRGIKTETTETLKSDNIARIAQNGKYFVNDYEEIKISIKLPKYTFSKNESVQLYIGDIQMSSNQMTAGPNGEIEADIVLVNTPSKRLWKDTKYKLTITGNSSGAQAVSTVSIFCKIHTQIYDVLTKKWHEYYKYDPLAETFIPKESCYISAISVIFNLMSPTGVVFPENLNFILPDNVTMCIAETTVGYPDPTKVLRMVNVPLGTNMNNTTWHKINLDDKLYVEANKSYCFYFLAPYEIQPKEITIPQFEQYYGSRIMLRSAKLSEKTPYAPYKLINEQPYIDGVMFKSSNATTWTPFQNYDLTFKIHTNTFELTKQVVLDTVEIDSSTITTDMSIDTNTLIPAGTAISNILDVTYTDDTTESFSLVERSVNQPSKSSIKSIVPKFNLVSSSENITPTLYDSPVLQLGTVNSKSYYVTKNIDYNFVELIENCTLKVAFFTNSFWNQNRIEVYYNNNQFITTDNWIQITNNDQGDFTHERVFSISGVPLYKHLRIMVILKVDNINFPNERLEISNFRTLVSTN